MQGSGPSCSRTSVSPVVDALEQLAAQASGCRRCRLAETRTQVVFGVGDPSSRLVFVGEAPGRDEDLKGEPFVGRSGQLQLDLIDPIVVVTLGNFASKLLLATSDGITKLRGRTYPYRNGVLVPTFHPAAVLRGGGEPMAKVRADLVRVKEALAAAAAA